MRKSNEKVISAWKWSESEKAWCLVIPRNEDGSGSTKEYWFPKKCCKFDAHTKSVTVPYWLYRKIYPLKTNK